MGIMSADDFYSGTVAAASGGTTTIIPFAAQHRGSSVTATVADYHERARTKAVIDYGFHLIIGDPTDQVLNEDLPGGDQGGLTSFKVYMTYPKWRLEDYQLLDVLAVAERERALVMVHAENDDDFGGDALVRIDTITGIGTNLGASASPAYSGWRPTTTSMA
jgi:dihydropyrimidinase